ncbi:ATP-binding protein [Thermodesulfobacteriota bacterium]
MDENIYLKLCNHLNKYPLWAPPTDAFLKILQIMFTPEEAEFALSLSPRLETVSQIAQRTGKDSEDVRNLLEQMVKNGVLIKESGSSRDMKEDRYGLLPTAPGIWEVTFAKKEKNPRTEKLGRLWREHYEQGWAKEMHRRIKTPAMRVLAVGQSIGTEVEVLPYEKASELLKTANFCAVCDCACRSASELAGKGCEKPTDVCLMFGDFARFLVETDRARQIDYEQALDVLRRTEEAGLVHLTMNTSDAVASICSCCSCCCTQLRAISYLSKPSAVAKSRFIASLNSDLCTGCGMCQDRCQVNAIKLSDETAELVQERCIGCGLCVTTCPSEAIVLIERTEYEKPIPTIRELILGMKNSANKPANQ